MIKRPKISKHEIIADIIFIIVGMFVAFLAVLIFDYHWSFYPGETIFPPSKHIFKTPTPYYVAIPLGGLIGFLVLKLLFYAFMEEESAIKEMKWTGYGKKKKRS